MFTLVAAAALTAALPSTLVRHADLDLATAAGRTALDHRIARAARSVCRPESSLNQGAATRRCVSETITAARLTRDQTIATRVKPMLVVAR